MEARETQPGRSPETTPVHHVSIELRSESTNALSPTSPSNKEQSTESATAESANAVSLVTWLQLGLLSAAWACSFSLFTASAASLSVASKQVMHEERLSTLPTALILYMTALSNIFIAWEVERLGRKWANIIGAIVGILGSGFVALALVRRSFCGLCLATALMGFAYAHGQLYRFSAVDFVPAEHRSTAIAIVLSGGVIGAVVGPEYSKRTRLAIPEHPFVGCFLATVGVSALNLVLILLIRFPQSGSGKQLPAKSAGGAAAATAPPSSLEDSAAAGGRGIFEPAGAVKASLCEVAESSPDDGESRGACGPPSTSGRAPEGAPPAADDPTAAGAAADPPPQQQQQRSLRQLISPVDVHTSIAISAISQGTMCFLMLPVPVAMINDGFSFADAALVMQLHLICMYLPSFLSGRLVPWLGAAKVQVLGAVVLAAGTGVFLGGETLAHYVAGEILNGVGWNLLFTGATNTLATASAARGFSLVERTRVQAANDVCVFVLAGTGSFTSSVALQRVGWTVMQYLSQACCGMMLALMARVWFWERRRGAAAARLGEAAGVGAAAAEKTAPKE